jgi:hypothetical protein
MVNEKTVSEYFGMTETAFELQPDGVTRRQSISERRMISSQPEERI